MYDKRQKSVVKSNKIGFFMFNLIVIIILIVGIVIFTNNISSESKVSDTEINILFLLIACLIINLIFFFISIVNFNNTTISKDNKRLYVNLDKYN